MNSYLKAFSISNYANFSGRAARTEYWLFSLINTLLLIIPIFISNYYSNSQYGNIKVNMYFAAYILVLEIIVFIPSTSITVRRLHDSNKSGLWYLIQFIPFGSIVLFVLCLLPGTREENKYGPNPRYQINYDN